MEKTMKKTLLALMILGLFAIAPGLSTEARIDGEIQAKAEKALVLDVACDARTFRLNKGGTILDALRGDGFIVQGKIYPGNTIPRGGTLETPGPFNPDTAPGAIGTWVCRGTFFYDIVEIMSQGKEPHLFSTQFHVLDDGRTLIHDGPEGGPQVRAIIGGMGDFSGASGEVFEEPLGTNSTGLFNIRFTIKIEKKSIK
jgi:hypothetical protein